MFFFLFYFGRLLYHFTVLYLSRIHINNKSLVEHELRADSKIHCLLPFIRGMRTQFCCGAIYREPNWYRSPPRSNVNTVPREVLFDGGGIKKRKEKRKYLEICTRG